MSGRYRGYTSYSEENGKLVPSIEPFEKDVKYQITEEEIKKSIAKAAADQEKKLKSSEIKKERPTTP